jgi:hypothetical protein
MGTHPHASENYDGKEPPNTPDFSFSFSFFEFSSMNYKVPSPTLLFLDFVQKSPKSIKRSGIDSLKKFYRNISSS